MYPKQYIAMKRNPDALCAKYVIDGAAHDVTPADMLDECMMPSSSRAGQPAGDIPEIWDETVDTPPENMSCTVEDIPIYIKKVTAAATAAQDRGFDLLYPESFTRQRVASALIDTLWLDGEFRLDDLRLWAEWNWNPGPVGNMSAFYASVQSATEYIYDLGVEIQGYLYDEGEGECLNSYFTTLSTFPDGDEQADDMAEIEDVPDKDWEEDDAPVTDSLWTVGGCSDIDLDEGRDVWMGDGRKCSAHLAGTGNSGSFLVYVPFDTCTPKLGGSLLAKTLGLSAGAAPQISDPDYFIDCYEVVRDLVSDGVVLSARTVCDGGLAVAAEKLSAGSEAGIRLNVNGICGASGETDMVKVLFAEIPGVLLQIDDNDSDYIDSQFLLQDVAYYRVGRPDPSLQGVEVAPESNGVDRILASLLADSSEGED